MPIWTGYNPPFLPPGDVLPLQQDARLIKNDLLQLLLTNPGERVMKPDIGSPIPSMQFENLVSGDIATAKADIASSIATFEPRVTIVDIWIKQDPDQNLMTITLFGTVNLNPSEQFKIEVGISDGGTEFVRAA
jgi:phage baseplate assembly protein W